jgi:hypothetical protein
VLSAAALLVATALVVSVLVGAGVAAEAPRARVLAGWIFRDAETVDLIAETREVALEPARRGAYRLVLAKSRYRLEVREGGRTVKVFPVALGPSPAGAKRRQGDGRTPEGRYLLTPHHPSPSFGSCFYVHYPAPHDVERALAAGRIGSGVAARIRAAAADGRLPPHDTPLGGLILLHATKTSWPGLTRRNWTEGCVALEKAHLAELLAVYRPEDRPTLEIVP